MALGAVARRARSRTGLCLVAALGAMALSGCASSLPRPYERLEVSAAPRLAKIESRWITNLRFIQVVLSFELPGVKESDSFDLDLDDFEFRFENASFGGISYSTAWSEGLLVLDAQLHYDPRDSQPAHPGKFMDFEAHLEVATLHDSVSVEVPEWPSKTGQRQRFPEAPGLEVECVEWGPQGALLHVHAPAPERVEVSVQNAKGEAIGSSGQRLLLREGVAEFRLSFSEAAPCPGDARLELRYSQNAKRFSGPISATKVPVVDASW